MPIAYERHGSGSPLVLIHGLGHRRQGWDAVLGLLSPHHEVITLDLPGHGESPMLELNGERALPAYVDRLTHLFDDLGLEKPHLAGNSLGGALALALAARGRGASVTALSPAGFFAHQYQIAYAGAVFATALAATKAIRPIVPALSRSPIGRTLLFGSMAGHPERATPEQLCGDVLNFSRTGKAMRAVFATQEPFVESVEVPVTIAWGTKDRVLMPSNTKVARRRLPGARFVWLDGCGHVPMTDEPELVARVILEGAAGEEPDQASHSSATAQPGA